MSFNIVAEYLLRRTGTGVGAGLTGLERLLERLGSPQKNFKIIHVAGTNGKGTVCSLLAQVLTCAGYKTGLFVSPHLTNLTERIQIDGRAISKPAFTRIVLEVFQEEEEELNFFEILTAAALLYFSRKKVDYVVLETGLGGRKDPTNVCTPVLSLISSIGLDHTQYLGSTLGLIAREKAGIIKPGIPVLCGEVSASAREEIVKYARRQKSPCEFITEGMPFYEYAYDFVNAQTILHTQNGEEWILHALGSHQTRNACLVYRASLFLGIKKSAIQQAFSLLSLPGRFEIFRRENQTVILDGAHNPQAVEGFVSFLEKNPLMNGAVLLCGFMQDKDYKKMLALLAPHFSKIILTQPPSPRGMGEDILEVLPAGVDAVFVKDWKTAWKRCRGFSRVVCTGSFYLVGALRSYLLKSVRKKKCLPS